MPRSTFVGFNSLESRARQRAALSIYTKACRRPESQARKPPASILDRRRVEALYLHRGWKNAQFVSVGFSLRVSPMYELRLRTRSRPSVLQTLYAERALGIEGRTHVIAAPIFLAPIIAFLKSSFTFKAGAAIVTFVKTSFVAKAFSAAVAYLKSGTVFKAITTVGRVSLSVIAALRLQGRKILHWWHGKEKYEKIRAERIAAGEVKRSHFRRTTMLFIATPIALLAIAILASLERTPVWGRWRVIMMSTDEEARLVEEFLRPGSSPDAHLDATAVRDWLAILRAASGEEAGPPGTLMGMTVLDPRVDWRARWVMDVFAYLEGGVKRVNLTSEQTIDGYNVFEIDSSRFAVPPVEYPLTIRPAALKNHGRSEDEHVEGPLLTRYGLLVVDSPVCNAFSLGFGPALQSESNENAEAPGIVVVFTGLLDEILRENHSSPEPEKSTPPASNALFGVFQQATATRPQYPNMPVIPTKRDTDQLASTLAHELGHLLLSHSLESWASSNMYELIGTLATDLIRTVLYPLTAFLGPIFNDWFGEQIRINSALGLRVTSSCASRKAEIEADLIGLRILLGAGIDPRIALDEWVVGGLFDRAERREGGEAQTGTGASDDGGETWLDKNGFARSHPMNEERHRRISEELMNWEKLGKELSKKNAEARQLVDDAGEPRLPFRGEAQPPAHTTS